jgi:hypothetical protein
VFRPTWDTTRAFQDFAYGAITLFRRTFQNVPLSIQVSYCSPATPTCKQVGLDCSAFARHYLRNHCCFLFLRLLRCFTSPGFALMRYLIHTPITEHYLCWVFPFGHLRIKACLQLPEAFRSLPRPSSPINAKASTVRP